MSKIIIIAKKTWKEILSKRETQWIVLLLNVTLLTTTSIHYYDTTHHNEHTEELSGEVREKWEGNPEKHPHRMAHYGYVVFRQKYPLSFFDKGYDHYFGNSVFLEAHKQNTVNFSEHGFSNSLLAFGEISAGMLLQLLLTLLILFWGYGMISRERESGMLKLMLTQGVSLRSVALGKAIGLFYLSLLVVIPVFVLTLVFISVDPHTDVSGEAFVRYLSLLGFYLLYFFILCICTVLVSATVSSSRLSLTLLVGYWLFFIVVFPKLSVYTGENMYPSLSKVEFDIKVKKETLKNGDSHNPNDPYFNRLRDSLLLAYRVDSVQALPINYGGFVMKQGEKLSSKIYNEQKDQLVQTYIKQQNFMKWGAVISPFIAIKNISVALSGTSYVDYAHFEKQAEEYRYFLAQYLNDLHIKYISNNIKSSADKRSALDPKYWKEMKDFEYKFTAMGSIIHQEVLSILSLVCWLVGGYALLYRLRKVF